MQVNSAQDYLTQVKRQILAKAPALALSSSPQNRRSNDTYTAQLANRASQYEKVPYPQTLSLAPGSVPGFAYVTPGLRPTVSLCCIPDPGFIDVWAGKLAVVTTLAGGGLFSNRQGIAAISNSSVVIAGNNTQRIHLVGLPSGSEVTLAGSGSSGFTDATGVSAQFANPFGVAVLLNGNYVVADINNNRIRLVTPGGVVTTLAGQATGGSADGTGTAAQFDRPTGVTVLPNGNIIVSEFQGNRIRLVTPGGVVTTLASGLDQPAAVAALSNNSVAILERNGRRIKLLTISTGVVTTLAGSGSTGSADGIGTAASFNYPYGIAMLPNGNLVVADSEGNRIRLVTPAGVVTTLAGSGAATSTDGVGTAATIYAPVGLTVLPNGTIVVVEFNNNRLRLITPT